MIIIIKIIIITVIIIIIGASSAPGPWSGFPLWSFQKFHPCDNDNNNNNSNNNRDPGLELSEVSPM